MRSQMCVMAAKCVKCEEVFDMSYDYNRDYENSSEREKKSSELMCWECRKNA